MNILRNEILASENVDAAIAPINGQLLSLPKLFFLMESIEVKDAELLQNICFGMTNNPLPFYFAGIGNLFTKLFSSKPAISSKQRMLRRKYCIFILSIRIVANKDQQYTLLTCRIPAVPFHSYVVVIRGFQSAATRVIPYGFNEDSTINNITATIPGNLRATVRESY